MNCVPQKKWDTPYHFCVCFLIQDDFLSDWMTTSTMTYLDHPTYRNWLTLINNHGEQPIPLSNWLITVINNHGCC